MREALLWTSVLVCAAAFAQHAETDPAQSSNVHGKSARSSIRGCLVAGREGFSVIEQQTATEYQLEGHTAELQRVRGHLVEVQGEQYPPATKLAPLPSPRLKVRQVRTIAESCPSPAPSVEQGTGPAANGKAGPVKTPPYREPGGVGRGTQPTGPVGPGTGTELNRSGASGAPSPGSNDPRNREPAANPSANQNPR
jgi:hypothetical protein